MILILPALFAPLLLRTHVSDAYSRQGRDLPYAKSIRKIVSSDQSLSGEIVSLPTAISPEVADNLATALHATAKRVGSSWKIVRSNQQRRELENDDRNYLKHSASLAAATSKTQDKATNVYETLASARKLKPDKNSNILDKSSLRAQSVSPAATLLARLLADSPEQAFSNARPGTISVFSSNPVEGEIPIDSFKLSMDQYISAQQEFSEWSEQALAEGKIASNDRWLFPDRPFTLGPKTIRFIIDRREIQPSFAITVYDAQGQQESFALLSPLGFLPIKPLLTKDANPYQLGRLPLSESSIAYSEAVAVEGQARTKKILDPDVFEPLALVEDVARLYARERKYSRLIACLPDSLLRPTLARVNNGSFDLAAFSQLIADADCEEISQGDLLIIRPRHPLQEEALRIDRRALSTAVKASLSRSIDFSDFCRLHAAYAQEMGHSDFLDLLVSRLNIALGWNKTAFGLTPHAWLAALGAVDVDTRKESSPEITFSLRRDSIAQLQPLSELAERGLKGRMSDLERTSTHLLAQAFNANNLSLSLSIGSRTLVKRINLKYMERNVVRPNGEVVVEKGENLVLDNHYLSTEAVLTNKSVFSNEDWIKILNENYRFLWVQDSMLLARVSFGPNLPVSPIAIALSRIEGSQPVRADELPGVSFFSRGLPTY